MLSEEGGKGVGRDVGGGEAEDLYALRLGLNWKCSASWSGGWPWGAFRGAGGSFEEQENARESIYIFEILGLEEPRILTKLQK